LMKASEKMRGHSLTRLERVAMMREVLATLEQAKECAKIIRQDDSSTSFHQALSVPLLRIRDAISLDKRRPRQLRGGIKEGYLRLETEIVDTSKQIEFVFSEQRSAYTPEIERLDPKHLKSYAGNHSSTGSAPRLWRPTEGSGRTP